MRDNDIQYTVTVLVAIVALTLYALVGRTLDYRAAGNLQTAEQGALNARNIQAIASNMATKQQVAGSINETKKWLDEVQDHWNSMDERLCVLEQRLDRP